MAIYKARESSSDPWHVVGSYDAPIRYKPDSSEITPDDYLVVDNGSAGKATIEEVVGLVAPTKEEVGPLINQWDEEWESGIYNWTTGVKGTNSGRIRSKNYIEIKPSSKFYLNSSAALDVHYYDSAYTFLTSASIAKNAEFTTPSNAKYMTLNTPSDVYGTVYKNDISINYPVTYTGYYPAKLSKVDRPWADLLWENASPGSEFAAQTISLNISEYDFFVVMLRDYADYADF